MGVKEIVEKEDLISGSSTSINHDIDGNQYPESNKDSGLPCSEVEVNENVVEARQLLLEGRTYFQNKNWRSAADTFSEAIKILATSLGEQADELSEPYYLYGCSLLELGNTDLPLLGEENNLSEDSDAQSDCNEAAEELPSTKSLLENSNVDNIISNLQEKTDLTALMKSTNQLFKDLSDTLSSKIQKDSSEVDDLECAWEVLELSRIIYERQEGKELELANVHLKLGELNHCNGNQADAIKDFRACLEIREKFLSSTDRSLAEIHCLLGSVCEAEKLFNEAKFHFYEAASVIRSRMELLLSGAYNPDSDEIQRELKELESCLLELENRVQDVFDWETSERLKENEREAKPSSSTNRRSPGAVVHDITDRIKRSHSSNTEPADEKTTSKQFSAEMNEEKK